MGSWSTNRAQVKITVSLVLPLTSNIENGDAPWLLLDWYITFLGLVYNYLGLVYNFFGLVYVLFGSFSSNHDFLQPDTEKLQVIVRCNLSNMIDKCSFSGEHKQICVNNVINSKWQMGVWNIPYAMNIYGTTIAALPLCQYGTLCKIWS